MKSNEQVPRDEKFWNTYNAVQQEHHEAWTKIRCEEEGHILQYTISDSGPSCKCGMSPLEIAKIYDRRGWGKLTVNDDGTMTFQAGKS